MCNQIAILSHLKGEKGEEVILGKEQHISLDETGAPGVISGCILRTL